MITILEMLCGPSATGKSSFAKQHALEAGMLYLSSDALRAQYGKDENDQSVSGIVFRNMEVFTDLALSQGFSVMLDATFLYPKAREPFINISKKYKTYRRAHLFNCPIDLALIRNENRARKVPPDIIQKQYNKLVCPTFDEFNWITEHSY